MPGSCRSTSLRDQSRIIVNLVRFIESKSLWGFDGAPSLTLLWTLRFAEALRKTLTAKT